MSVEKEHIEAEKVVSLFVNWEINSPFEQLEFVAPWNLLKFLYNCEYLKKNTLYGCIYNQVIENLYLVVSEKYKPSNT